MAIISCHSLLSQTVGAELLTQFVNLSTETTNARARTLKFHLGIPVVSVAAHANESRIDTELSEFNTADAFILSEDIVYLATVVGPRRG
jgi:hypothetical protein